MIEYNGEYKDIINLPRHISKKHPQMSLEARSAQFAPFAALTGYEDLIEETGRLTDKKIEIDEESKEILDRKIRVIKEKILSKPIITITYFVNDLKKEGGKYKKTTGIIKKIDEYKQMIILEDKSEIIIDDIIDISGDIFI